MIGAFGSPRSKLYITVGEIYDIHAVSVFSENVAFLIIDDTKGPKWLPGWLFETIDTQMPPDWICNTFAGEVQLVLGPPFVAYDLRAYEAMVQLEPEQVTAFWQRIDSMA